MKQKLLFLRNYNSSKPASGGGWGWSEVEFWLFRNWVRGTQVEAPWNHHTVHFVLISVF